MPIFVFEHDGRRVAGLLDGAVVRPIERNGIWLSPEEVLNQGPAGADDWTTDSLALPLEGLVPALPVSKAGKILCVGLNFLDHAAEGGHAIPDYPALFFRSRTSVVAHGAPLVRPRVSQRFDYEGELVAVIGRRVRHLSEADALTAVWGYTIMNDGSLRDYQRRGAQWTPGKNFDSSGSIGPWIAPAKDLPPGAYGLRLQTRVNGQVLQDGNTSDMIFSVAKILAIVTEIMTLEPGDLVAFGTPAGVGFARKPPIWLRPGDVCEVEVEGIGTLFNPVVAEPEPVEGGNS
jgi:acylpyruvate hydrolase